MRPISKLQEYLESIVFENSDDIMEFNHDVLSVISDELLAFDEFKDVKKINILNMPIYKTKKGSNIPISNDDTYLGGETDTIHSVCYKLNDGECTLNEEIDLYSISLTPVIYDPKDINDITNKIGVYRTPLLYDPKTFAPTERISITWSTVGIKDSLGHLTPEEQDIEIRRRLMKMFEDALDGKCGLPKRRGVIVRISPRSFKSSN